MIMPMNRCWFEIASRNRGLLQKYVSGTETSMDRSTVISLTGQSLGCPLTLKTGPRMTSPASAKEHGIKADGVATLLQLNTSWPGQ